MTKILIAGLGSIGRRHLRNLVALGESQVILVRSHRSTLPEAELAGFRVETDIREALSKHQPDAVIVANPTSLHLEIATPAAEAGCAILLEKPVSHSMDGLDGLQAAVRESGAKVLMGFQLRFHPSLVRAQEMLGQGRIGKVLSSRVHFGEYLPAWHPWEDYRQGYAARADLGGGVLLTQCHALDYLPWLIGPVDSVWGGLGQLSDLDIDVDDTAEVSLRFEAGCFGSLHLDFAQKAQSHRLEIHGSAGSLICDLLAGTTSFYDADLRQWEESGVPPGWERNAMFREEMSHFLQVVKGKAEPLCTLEDGIRVMRLVDAVRESDRSGCRVSLQP